MPSRLGVRPWRRRRHRRREVVAAFALTAITVATCAALLAAAALVPAPAAVLPLVAVVCLGCPMFAVWELSRRFGPGAGVRAAPDERTLDAKALEELRRALARLPETRHPLGL
jgi:peptidoglycan/LPS O-acetylase OafA/YrhL